MCSLCLVHCGWVGGGPRQCGVGFCGSESTGLLRELPGFVETLRAPLPAVVERCVVGTRGGAAAAGSRLPGLEPLHSQRSLESCRVGDTCLEREVQSRRHVSRKGCALESCAPRRTAAHAGEMLRSFTLQPHPIQRNNVKLLIKLQRHWNKLYKKIAQKPEFITAALRHVANKDAWQHKEIKAFHKTMHMASQKPTLLLPNSVYQQDKNGNFTCTCSNVQAGEPYQLQLVHTLQAPGNDHILPGSFATVCRVLNDMARLVHPSAPCVAIVSKPPEKIAWRTRIDLHGICAQLSSVYGVRVKFTPMRDLARARLDSCGDLILDGQRISLLYSRFDFSHPWGRFVDERPAGDSAEEFDSEWSTIERLEVSNAILSSSLAYRLAHRRAVQHALVRRGGLEQLVSAEEASDLRGVIPQQWALWDAVERDEFDTLFKGNPGGFVAKNVLRPRTGSSSTQGRSTSGGDIIASPTKLADLLQSEFRDQYVAYPRVYPRSRVATFVHNGVAHETDSVAEVASYGCLQDGLQTSGMVNSWIGIGARARPASAHHFLSRELGYGALSACTEV